MDTPESRLAALQAEAQQLTQYLTALPPEAWSHPSACTRWQVADVVAHLATAGLLFTEWLTRGLQGDSSPPAGWILGGARDEDAFAEELAQRAIASRRQLEEQLLATFIQGNTALHQLLSSLALHDWETLCYHPAGPRTVWAMVEARTTELAMHGWDIRSQLEPIAHLLPASLPALFATVDRAVRRAFRPDMQRSRPLRYRFVVTGPLATTTDIVLSREGARLEPPNGAPADVLFRCEAETYVLVVFGRRTLGAAITAGEVVVEGDQTLAGTFEQSFKGG